MANNSNRKAIEFMVQGALPPHSTNVLWMDTSVPTLPVLKIFENGAWTTVHTGDSKAVELLAETVLAQQGEITELTEGIKDKMALDATVAKDSSVKDGNDTIIGMLKSNTYGLSKIASDAAAAKTAAEAVQMATSSLPTLQQMKDAGFIPISYDGITLYNPQTISFLALSLNLSNIKAIVDDSIGSLTASQGMFNSRFTNLNELTLNACLTLSGTGPFVDNATITKVSMPSLISCSASFAFHRAIALMEVYIPKCETISQANAFTTSPEIRIIDISNLTTGFGNLTITSLNCIDLITGKKVQGDFSLSSWSPTYALLPDSTSLLTPEDIAAGFTSNLEKLLYNIREHIAVNLPDRTGLSSSTITFSAAVKAAILADQPTADAFTNKNWTIA